MKRRLAVRILDLFSLLAMTISGVSRFVVRRPKNGVALDLGRAEIKRYVLQVVKGLNRRGETVVITSSFRSLLNFQRTQKEVLGDPNTYVLPGLPPQICHRINVEGSSESTSLALSFDVFAPDRRSPCIFWPQTIHPAFLTGDYNESIKTSRKGTRDIAALFAGNISPDTYANPITKELFGILTRHEFIQCLEEQFGNGGVAFPNSYAEFLRAADNGKYAEKVVVCDAAKCRIPRGDWFRTLARARFFLSPPGVLQPFCHNTVEAMAVGTVPILQYPDVYDPNLCDEGAARTFQDEEGLVAVVREALSSRNGTGLGTWSALSAGAIEYYGRYLSPESFHRRFYESLANHNRLTIYVCQNRVSTELHYRRYVGDLGESLPD